jgi:hypothetical protein
LRKIPITSLAEKIRNTTKPTLFSADRHAL